MAVIELDTLKEQAPDRKSFGNAKKLAKVDKWDDMGRKDDVLWGLTTGSSGDTYYVYVKGGSAPRFECSCPSRKRPCKHALGLAILEANEEDSVPQADVPSGHEYMAEDRYYSSWSSSKTRSRSLRSAR
jgi:hypothetical protein